MTRPITLGYASPESTLQFIFKSPELHAMLLFVGTILSTWTLFSFHFILPAFFALTVGFISAYYVARGQTSLWIDNAKAIINQVGLENIPLKTDHVALVTGGSSGIGFAALKELLNLGIFVIIAVRNPEKMQKAIAQDIQTFSKSSPFYKCKIDTHYIILPCDLNNLDALFNEFYIPLKKRLIQLGITKINYLINNAGAMVTKPSLKGQSEGILPVSATLINNNSDYTFKALEEVTNGTTLSNETVINNVDHSFTTNHLGHFFITLLLLPYLLRGDDCRIVNTSSAIHVAVPKHQSLLVSLMNNSKTWNAPEAYQNTKILNLWFTNALSRRLEKFNNTNIYNPSIINEIVKRYTNANNNTNHNNKNNDNVIEDQPSVIPPTAYTIHPGTVWSPFHAPFYYETPIYLSFFFLMLPLAFFSTKTIEEGCLTTIHCCIGRNVSYFKSLFKQIGLLLKQQKQQKFDEDGVLQSLMKKYNNSSPQIGPQPGQFHSECRVSAQGNNVIDITRQEELWQLSLLLVRKYINKDNYELYDYIQ